MVHPCLDRKCNILYSNKVKKLLIRTREPNLDSARVRKDNTDTQWSINQLPSDAPKFLTTAFRTQSQTEPTSCPGGIGNKGLPKAKDRKTTQTNKKHVPAYFLNPSDGDLAKSWFGFKISIISQAFVFTKIFVLHNGNKYAFENARLISQEVKAQTPWTSL